MTVTSAKLLAGMSFIAILVFGYVVMPQVPVPTPDSRVTETRVAFNQGATYTASEPTSTAVPITTITSVAAATLVASPPPTISVSATSLPTATRTPPTSQKAAPSATRTARVTATRTATRSALPTKTTPPSPSPSSTATPAVTSTPDPAPLVPAKRAFDHHYVIQEDYDAAKDQTTVSLEERPQDLTAVPNSLYVMYAVPGNQRAIPNSVAVSFFSTSQSWQFLPIKEIVLRLDGTVNLSWEVTERGAANAGSVIELLTANAPSMDFLRLVNASRVEIQIGSYYFELTTEQMEALRDLASRMSP